MAVVCHSSAFFEKRVLLTRVVENYRNYLEIGFCVDGCKEPNALDLGN
jgi:hypothetical protein